MEKTALEQFKQQVADNLTSLFGKESSQRIMKDYENDFPMFYKEGWTVEGLTPAIANYFI